MRRAGGSAGALHGGGAVTAGKPAPWTPPAPLPSRYETARLVLRWWAADDADGMLAAIEADRSALLPWLPWVRTDNHSVAECTYNIERFRRTREQSASTPVDFAIGLFDRRSGEPVGGSGFHRIDVETHQAEIGYWVRGDRHRSGLATEATAAMLTWGFAPASARGWGFRRIEIRCAASNVGSRRVPEKLGMRREMTLVQDRWIDGVGFDDTVGFALLADEWNGSTASL